VQGFADRLVAVRERIMRAAVRAGRDPAGITLVGASKQVPVERLREAVAAGLAHLGENRVQEAKSKMEAWGSCPPRPTWHLIGHLQSNKARAAALLFDWVHSIDSPDLVKELDRRAAGAGRKIRALVEVNASGEAGKFGATPEKTLETLEAFARASALEPRGLMTMGPLADDPETARPAFRATARLLAEARRAFPRWTLDQLSMGMSGDLEVAIEEGATLIRVGTALFGPRA